MLQFSSIIATLTPAADSSAACTGLVPSVDRNMLSVTGVGVVGSAGGVTAGLAVGVAPAALAGAAAVGLA